MVDEALILRRLLDVTLDLGAERRTEPVLRQILAAARELAGARYAAIGVPDGDGGFALFLTSGVDAHTWDLIGSLPRTHGLLGALLASPRPIRLADIRDDPRFGYYPKHHPVLRSFLGMPIVAGGEVLAELFLADKTADPAAGGPGPEPAGVAGFTKDDERVVGMLAAHAALAVANAQRTERARELSVAEERTRLARDLHDSVTQTLFSLSLAAEAADALSRPAAGRPEPGSKPGSKPGSGSGSEADRDGRLAEQLDRVRLLARTALTEMRTLVDTLRPPDVDADGLAAALRRRVALLRRVHEVPIELTTRGPARLTEHSIERETLRVANEALANALQHAGASRIEVRLDTGGDPVRLVVLDDGSGFDLAEVRRVSRRLGLTSMRERAEALGGTLHLDTAPGEGTRVTLEVPAGG
jgi:signal transduction histidine kinase